MHPLRHICICAQTHTLVDDEGRATRPRSCSLKRADGWLTDWTGPWKYFCQPYSLMVALLAHWPRRGKCEEWAE